MKKLILLFLTFVLITACKTNENKTQKPNFLIGNWIRLNDKPGSQTYETWSTNLTGMGYTKQGKKRTFQETMAIVSINDTLYLEVKPVSEKTVLFKFTEQTDTSFVCENPQNDFPKKIKYYLENKQLKAQISADDFRIDFIFDPLR